GDFASLNNSPIPGLISDGFESSEFMRDPRPRQGAADLGGALHLQGEDAQPDMRLDPPRRPMEHRADLEPGLLHSPEARFDDPGAFVSKRHVLGGERVVIGDDDELAVEFLRRLDLLGIESRAAQIVGVEIAAVAARDQQRAGRLRMIRLALAQEAEFGSELDEHLLAMETLAFGLFGIEAEHVAPAALALANHDLLDLEIVGHRLVAARTGQHLDLDLLHLAHRHGQDIAAETARERRHVLGRIHAGIADEHTAAEPPGAQIVLDPRHGGDVGGVPRQNPRPDRHAVARHREGDDDLRLIVPAFLVVAAPAQRCIEPSAPFLRVLVSLIDLEISRGGVVEDQIDIEPEQIGRLEEDLALNPVRPDGEEIERAVEASLEPGASSRFAAMAKSAASCGAVSSPAAMQRRIAAPMPRSSHSPRAASTTPSSNTCSISIGGSSGVPLVTASPWSSTRLMLLTRRC